MSCACQCWLFTIIDNKLRWDANTEVIAKKGQQRLYFLRKLNSFSVDTKCLTLFYKSFIESILTFSFICWFGSLSVKNKKTLEKIVCTSSKIIGESQRSLQHFFEQQVLRKSRSILACPEHVLFSEFERLPSGRRFRSHACRTNRRKFSFIPLSITLLNKDAWIILQWSHLI